MLDDKDIQKIIKVQQEVFPAREEVGSQLDEFRQDFQSADNKLLGEIFAVRKNLESFGKEMKESFSVLRTLIDVYAKKADSHKENTKMKLERQPSRFYFLQPVTSFIYF